MNWFGGDKPKPAIGLAACFAALVLAAACPAKAQTACPATPPNMTIKIFNDSTDQYLFPELEVGLNAQDVWIQAICKVPNSQIGTHPYPTTLTNRFYVNPVGGIAPGQSVVITLPLYTQLVATVDPTMNNQYAEWWQGENMQIFTSPTSTPPKAFTEDYNSISRTGQTPLTSLAANPTFPSCAPPCNLVFFKDTQGTLPKNGPSQLVEATLGARQAQAVVNDSPPNSLDIANADFDISYVNLAYAPAAMGPVQNDQVGYVGSPQPFDAFQATLNNFFTKAFPGWPRFVVTYADNSKATIPKLPSPLELFARLIPPGSLAPPDLEPAPNWPTTLWAPIQALRTNFALYTKECHHSPQGDTTFCDALLDVKALIEANYQNYKLLFSQGKCTGTAVTDTPDAILNHVYGWGPWTEASAGPGCSATINLLQDTPGYWTQAPNKPRDYTQYLKVKLEFDKLQYGLLPQQYYVFDPWVEFIHNAQYLDIPGAYAYSVDDAVGNIQAEATGYIVDFGSLKNLENQLPASAPINISFGYSSTAPVRFTSYGVCNNDPSRQKLVNPLNPTFIISANNPKNCPVYLNDNKNVPQTYTFTVTTPPPFTAFTIQQVQSSQQKWSNTTPNTTAVIDCSGNTSTAPFQQSSKAWCCSLTNTTGVWAYTQPDPTSAHQSQVHTVVTNPAMTTTSSSDKTCSMGH